MTGDFLKAWLKCEAALKKNESEFGPLLLASLQKRETQLMENVTFLSAIYLDPRFRNLLTEQQVSRARIHLTKTWTKLQKMNPPLSNEVNVSDAVDESDEFDEFIKEREQSAAVTSSEERAVTSKSITHTEFILSLEKYGTEPRLNSRLSVLQFWQQKKFEYPELFKLSEIVLAVPMTQVSVERAFSGLRFVLSDLRCAVTSEVLKDIMLIRCNALFDN